MTALFDSARDERKPGSYFRTNPKRKTVTEKLVSIVSKEAAKIPDFRKRVGPDSISLHDAIMSGLAVMHLKKPSLLQFDLDCVKYPDGLPNLKSTC